MDCIHIFWQSDLPYRAVFKKFNLKRANTTNYNLRRILKITKQKSNFAHSGVCQLTCPHWGYIYIYVCQTSTSFTPKVTNMSYILKKNNSNNSRFAQHLFDNGCATGKQTALYKPYMWLIVEIA